MSSNPGPSSSSASEPPAIALSCSQCSGRLAGCRYILVDDQPACLTCFDSRLANTCAACQAKIGCDSKDVSYKQQHWHEACFRCAGCSGLLASSAFSMKDAAIYCVACYEARFAARCSRCGDPFRAGVRKFEFRERQFHEACFLCGECGAPIGGASFVPRGDTGDAACCLACYEAKYAQRCHDCRQVIRKGGVSYKGRPYHADCLVCANCSKQLCGLKFTSHEDRPFCGDCYGELFGHRCAGCGKPITGFTGTKFISFEDRDWHSACFNCALCGGCLVGKGFLADGQRVLCTGCSAAETPAAGGEATVAKAASVAEK